MKHKDSTTKNENIFNDIYYALYEYILPQSYKAIMDRKLKNEELVKTDNADHVSTKTDQLSSKTKIKDEELIAPPLSPRGHPVKLPKYTALLESNISLLYTLESFQYDANWNASSNDTQEAAS